MHSILAVIPVVGLLAAIPGGGAKPIVCAPLPFEVNTHQEMGLQAARRSANLARFLADFDLAATVYSRRHPDAAQRLSGRIRIANSQAVDLIGAGCVLEDSGHVYWNGRFYRHFYDPTAPIANRGLRNRLGEWQPSTTWGFNGGGETNDRSWTSALDYFEQALRGETAADRKEGQEDLFVSLGHVAHLIQDACQPSHTRNDSHPIHSELEEYGATNVGPGVPPTVQGAINALPAVYLNTLRGFFDEAAGFSNNHFFSDDTIFRNYALPSTATTSRRVDSVQGRNVTFVVSNSLSDPGNSTVRQRLARVIFGLFVVGHTLASPDDLVVLDNFETLMPRAVALSEGMLNHFLRGRIEMSIDGTTQPPQVKMKNVSDVGAVGGVPANVIFSGGQVRLFYESVAETMIELPAGMSPQPLPGALAVNQSVALQGNITGYLAQRLSPSLPPSTRARPDQRLIVNYRGVIGAEVGVCAGKLEWCAGLANMVSILPGTFQMGSNAGPPDFVLPYYTYPWERPVHPVTISRSFCIGKFEVTQAEYQAVMGVNPSYFQGASYPNSANRPVEQVSWNDAMAYCAALTAREAAAGRLPAGYQYRLPTEAEWEYCCRAGTTSEFSFGGSLSCAQGNTYPFPNPYCVDETRPVGVGEANPWGLHDCHGNVYEWCLDFLDFGSNYPALPVVDPYVSIGFGKVIRGGCWYLLEAFSRSAAREARPPSIPQGDFGIGFRVVLAPVLVP